MKKVIPLFLCSIILLCISACEKTVISDSIEISHESYLNGWYVDNEVTYIVCHLVIESKCDTNVTINALSEEDVGNLLENPKLTGYNEDMSSTQFHLHVGRNEIITVFVGVHGKNDEKADYDVPDVIDIKKTDCTHEIMQTKTQGTLMFGSACECAEKCLREYAGQVALCYIDPPFCTGKSFGSGDTEAYSDAMREDEYMSMMRSLLLKIHALLSDSGSLYLHIDYRMSAKLKPVLDEIFGPHNFRNEIIWSYNSGGRAKNFFPRKHDNIFFYTKSPSYYFNLDAVGVPRGKPRRNNMKKNTDENGLVYYSIHSNGKEYRYYETDLVYPTDVWCDIEHLHQRDRERTSYPTQKPLALLERIISASSVTGDLVCDFFSGSGTTAVAASLLGRNWIACDRSAYAFLTAKSRLPSGNCETHLLYNDMPQNLNVRVSVQDGTFCVQPENDEKFSLASGYMKNGVFQAVYRNTGTHITLPERTGKCAVSVDNKKDSRAFYVID